MSALASNLQVCSFPLLWSPIPPGTVYPGQLPSMSSALLLSPWTPMPSIPPPLPLRVPLAQQLCPKGSSEAWILALKGSGTGYVVLGTSFLDHRPFAVCQLHRS